MRKAAILSGDTSYLKMIQESADNNLFELRCVTTIKDFIKEIQKRDLKVAFLDMDLLKDSKEWEIIEERNIKTKIVVVSADMEMIYESLRYHPYWFLIKDEFFIKHLNIIFHDVTVSCMKKKKPPTMKPYGLAVLLKENKIVYIRSEKNYIYYILNDNQVIEERKTLISLEKQLAEYGFVRIHKRTLVNMKYVKEIDLRNHCILLKDKRRLEVGRIFQDNLNQTAGGTGRKRDRHCNSQFR